MLLSQKLLGLFFSAHPMLQNKSLGVWLNHPTKLTNRAIKNHPTKLTNIASKKNKVLGG